MNVPNYVEVVVESLEQPMPAFIRELTAVAVAAIGRDGTLRDANRGFLNLTANGTSSETTPDIHDLFVNPRFYQFAARHTKRRDRIVYRGILNLGQGDGPVVSLTGTVYGDDDNLLVVAEYDVAELERLNATLWQLNQDLAGNQRELVRLGREVEHKKALAEAALRDRDTLLQALSPLDQSREN